MSSGFKNYHFHREYHNDLMKNQAYVMLPLDCIGALAKLRNLAGLTDNSGSLRIGGSARLTFKEVCKWLAQTPEVTARRVRAILFRLVFDKFLTAVTPKGEAIELQRAAGEWLVPGRIDMDEAVVMVPNWDTEQHERAPSSEAERKRTQREREEERERESGRDEVFEEDFRRKSEENLSDGSTGVREFPKDSAALGVTCHTDCRLQTADCRKGDIPLHCKLSAPAVAPPPPQLRSREQNRTGGSGAGGTGEHQSQSHRQTQSQKQTAPPAAPTGQAEQAGGGGATAGGMVPGDDLYGMDPIEAYCLILGDRKQIAVRNAKSKLRLLCVASKDDDLGRQRFFQALAIMRDVMQAGTMPEFMEDGSRCVPWKYFEGVFKNVLEGRI